MQLEENINLGTPIDFENLANCKEAELLMVNKGLLSNIITISWV